MRLEDYPAQCVAMTGWHSVRGPQRHHLPLGVLELFVQAAAARAAWAARGLGLRLLERGRPCARSARRLARSRPLHGPMALRFHRFETTFLLCRD